MSRLRSIAIAKYPERLCFANASPHCGSLGLNSVGEARPLPHNKVKVLHGRGRHHFSLLPLFSKAVNLVFHVQSTFDSVLSLIGLKPKSLHRNDDAALEL